jgi:hypothetical protein
LLTLLLAGVLMLGSVVYALATLSRCRSLCQAPIAEDDPLEQRLAEKEQNLVVGLGKRSVLALGRASLFGGTGLGVWGLTGGSAHYLEAAAAFGLGLVGWATCGEAHRRIGSLADARRKPKRRQGVDQSERTG